MSSRALRRLREEKEAAALLLATTNEEEGDESSSEEEEVTTGGGGFMMMLDDESESESESESDDDDKKETTIDTITNITPNNESKKASPKKKAAEKKDEEEEDLDAILSDMNIIRQGTTTDTDHHAIDSAAVGNSNAACIQKHLKPNTIRQLLLSSSTTNNNKNEGGYHYDIQDLDLDYAMRSLVGGGANIAGDPFAMDDLHAQQQQQQRGRRGGHRTGGRGGRTKRLVKKYLFGKPRAEWGKPPSYVGGGLGMKELTADVLEEERHSWSIPWPYNNLYTNDTAEVEEEGENESSDADDDKLDNDDKDHNNKDGKNNKQQVPTHPSTTLSNNQKWYTLQMSDTYQETNYQYQEMLSTTGGGGGGEQGMHDPNALAMFVADHPYFAETLLQLAMVLYYINDRGKGNDLLRRCMFIYESALPMNVLPSSSATSSSGNNDNDNGNTTTDNNNNCEILIDIDRPPNSGLFATLFRIMQTSGMSGCYASALATGRYLLSLDPLRDPMGVLLILDYYALATRRISSMSFIVTLVQSNFITIHYKDPLTSRHHKCNLIDMPNWAFSYALALYRLAQQQQNENEDEDSGDESSSPSEQYQERAEEALVHALRTFPMVLPKLLAMNNVNVEDRGMIMDWPSILPLYIADANGTNSIATNDTVEDRVTRASGEHLVRIFVQRCHKLWKEDDLVKWMFHCAQRVIMEHREQEQEGKSSTPSTTTDTPSTPMTSTFSPALARYAQCDPSEYEDSFRTFPPEAIALDPNIVAPAMALGPNGRRRFLRQRGQQQQQQQLQREAGQGQDPLEIIRRLLGLGNDDGGLGDVEVLDPDSPLLQLYLQSLLPWAQVEGVRPPPR